MNTSNLLTREILHLKSYLPETPFLVGGGMGLYLRSEYHTGTRSPRYPRPVPTRSTKDIDVILSAELIADADQMDQIRDAIDDLGYQATAHYFQFERRVGDQGRMIEIDLLAAPPKSTDRDRVKQRGFRIRPLGSEKIHGRVANEARSIDRHAIPIDLAGVATHLDLEVENPVVHIPSSFNYLVLKLHAFSDRKGEDDEKSDLGRHHALDLFNTVTDMSKEDWENAQDHFSDECEADYIQQAIAIQREFFAQTSDLGVQRIRENKTYKRHSNLFDAYLSDFVNDMNDLFSGC